MQKIRICGIDASVSSTGIAFVECDLCEEIQESLSEILLDIDCGYNFLDTFRVLHAEEIPEDKIKKKELANLRKEIRSQTLSPKEMFRVEELLIARLIDTTDIIQMLIDSYRPVFVLTEDYSFHSTGSLTQLAELKGILKYKLHNNQTYKMGQDYLYFNAPITSVKKIASTKGNATKEIMCSGIKRFGLNYDEKEDDKIDAVAICVSTFYALYYRMFGVKFPDAKNAKERNDYKSWKNSLKSFADRIGTREGIMTWIKQRLTAD